MPLVFLLGCGSMATKKEFYEPITASVRAGDYSAAALGLEQAKDKGKYGKKDRLIYFIDAGLAYHYDRQFDSSNIRLHAAESAAEELFTKSISKAALSVVFNDNALDYAGEDYEVLYTNLISALNYAAQNKFDDAFVEVKRANLKLEQLEMKYGEAVEAFKRSDAEDSTIAQIDYDIEPVRFQNSAFARWLSMHMYAADGKFDDAQLDYELLHHAFETQPFIYNFEPPDIKYVSEDAAVLSVVALSGLSPVKEALNLRIRTDKDLDLVQTLYTDGTEEGQQYGQLFLPVSEDYYFKFAIPRLIDRGSIIDHAKVYADGRALGRLQVIEDVGRVSRETFKSKKSLIYIRTVLRAVAKGLVAHKQKEKADTGGLGGWLKKAAIDVVTDLSENADLRCARLLPGRILVGDFELPPGTYDLTIEFVDYDGNLVGGQSFPQYTVLESGLNLIQAASSL